MIKGKFDFQPYSDPARWRRVIYRVRYDGQHIGSVSQGLQGDWVVLLDTGGLDFGYQTRDAAANRLLVLSGLNAVGAAALPDDPFAGLTPKEP